MTAPIDPARSRTEALADAVLHTRQAAAAINAAKAGEPDTRRLAALFESHDKLTQILVELQWLAM